MIDVSELRVGSQIYAADKLITLSAQDIAYIAQSYRIHGDVESVRPVMLSEQTLQKLGFKHDVERTDYDLYTFGEITILYKRSGSMLYNLSQAAPMGKAFSYLHQLQNVCFDLYGITLEYKL